MLEKLKHKFKKKDRETTLDKKQPSGRKDRKETDAAENSEPVPPSKPKRQLPVKQLVILFIVITVSFVLAFFAYRFFVKEEDVTPRYIPKVLSHVSLPEEIMAFCFDHFPDLYQAILVFNDQMTLIGNEIQRISQIARQYPDHQKIPEREINSWETIRSALLKEFEKVQTILREVYVLYRVNPEQGQTRIESSRTELNDTALAALAAAEESTRVLESRSTPPEGMWQKLKHTVQKILQ